MKEKILSDEKIVELYFARDEVALDATDKKYGKYLYTVAYNIIHNNLDCEECLNDTYLSTWNTIPPKKPTALQVFLTKITRNIAVDKYRKASASKRVPAELVMSLEELDECVHDSPSAEEAYMISELVKILNETLRQMDEREQYAFICRYYYFDRTIEIAKTLGVSKSTILRALEKAREKLKERLEKEGYGQWKEKTE